MLLVNKVLIVCALIKANVLVSGQVDPYIIGGEDAKYIPHPWMVSLYFGCFDSCEPHERCQHMICGGTLIAPQWVLTAAHCFEATFENVHYFQVYVGDYDFMKDQERHERHMTVEQIIEHADYIHTSTTVENDIALIKLKETVEETPETKCLRLAQNNYQLKDDCHLFGWGVARQNEDDGNTCTKSNTLKSVDLNRVDLDTCRGYYPQNTLDDKNVCAGGEKNQGACFGDSGGGLYCPMKNDDIYELLGVSSWTKTNPCGSKNKPAVFTDVTGFRDWINNNCENCLDNYNNHNCVNSINIRPIIHTTTIATGCSYPESPDGGHYNCNGVDPGDLVGVGEVCYLVCDNEYYAGYIVCTETGKFDESNVNENVCSEDPTTIPSKDTTTQPTPEGSCPYPHPPLPGDRYNCPPYSPDETFINAGTACFLICQDGTFAGSAVCLENGQFDESQLDKWKCYPVTDCQKDEWDYPGNDISHFENIETWMECGVLCKDDQRCTHWTYSWNSELNKCWIKEGHNYGPGSPYNNCISGDSDCP